MGLPPDPKMPTTPLPSAPLEELKAAALAAGQTTDHAGYLQQAVEQLSRLVGADRCALMVLRDGRLYHGAAVGLPESYTDAINGFEVGPEVGTCGAAAARGEAVVTPDIHEDPRWADFRELADEAGLRACWSVPLCLPEGDVIGTFATYSDEPREPDEAEVDLTRAHASLVALGLERLRSEERLHESYEAVVVALSAALDVRDEYTGLHSTETAARAISVGRRLGLRDRDLRQLEQAAVLHDIGKLGIPTDILSAPRCLTEEEMDVVRQHPIIGERILKGVPLLEEVARCVRHEHERWDGGGYPDGLAGSEIPLISRIVFVCDAWHAMSSDRPYRPRLSHEEATGELQAGAGSQFDRQVAETLLEVLDAGPLTPEGGCEPDEDEARAAVLRSVAEAVGAEDLFVFSRVSPERFSHFGGVGRGEGWAGNVELVSDDEEEAFATALASETPVLLQFEGRGRVVGPYWARTAVIVPCRNDLVVVFGSSTDSLADACMAEMAPLAERAAAAIDEVSPEKRLADELEVLDAVRSITTITGHSLEDVLSRIADAAARALSCEFGAVVAFGEESEPRLGYADRGWAPSEPGALGGLLAPFVASHVELPLLIQDVCVGGPAPDAFAERGARSIHAVPIGDPRVAVLVMVHADKAPRGFTMLCRRVARAVAEAAEIVIRRSLAQEQLTQENARLSQRVRTDPLTGVASRTAWEEALRREEAHRARSGAASAIAVFDLDGLKGTNDRQGHAAGDTLLRACASVLAERARATDLIARIGGDEFACLLRYTDEDGAREWCDDVRDALWEHASRHPGLDLSVAAGVAAAPPAETLAEAFDEADRRMYSAKGGVR